MCRSRWLLLLVLVVGGGQLRGQELERSPSGTPSVGSGEGLARLRARADSLAHEWRRANAFADLVDSLERARVIAAKDTIRVGALTIITNPSPLPLREAAARAWPIIDNFYGSEARSLAGRPYIIVAVDPDTTVERPAPRSGIAVLWDVDVASLTFLLLTSVPIAQPDATLRNWLGGGSVRPSLGPERERASVFVQLVTAPSQATRDCFLGDTGSCRDALDIGDSPDVVLRWYRSPEQRRAVVTRSLGRYLDRGPQQQPLQSCAAGSDSSCIELLQSIPRSAVQPLAGGARETLVNLALRLGGREAYHRLIASPDAPVSTRLAAAAGMSIDSLAARWRSEILGSRPTPVSLPPRGPWIALGWVAFFTACGLRSSRWRVS